MARNHPRPTRDMAQNAMVLTIRRFSCYNATVLIIVIRVEVAVLIIIIRVLIIIIRYL